MATGDMSDHSGVQSITIPTGGYIKGLIYQLNSGGYVIALETKSAAETGLVAFITAGKTYTVTKNSGTEMLAPIK